MLIKKLFSVVNGWDCLARSSKCYGQFSVLWVRNLRSNIYGSQRIRGDFFISLKHVQVTTILIKYLNRDWVYIQAVELKRFRATPSILVTPSNHQSLMPFNKRRKCCKTAVHFNGIHFQSSAIPVLLYDSFAIQLTCLALNSFFFYYYYFFFHQVAPGYVMECCFVDNTWQSGVHN